MLTRFVKLTFRPAEIDTFLAVFEIHKEKIRHFPGCQQLHLLQDSADPRVFFTHSLWDSADDLENYRNSPLFKSTWAQTRVLFDAAPEAWSLNHRANV